MAGACGKAVNSLEVKKIDWTRVLWWKKICEERNIVKEEFTVLVTDKTLNVRDKEGGMSCGPLKGITRVESMSLPPCSEPWTQQICDKYLLTE